MSATHSFEPNSDRAKQLLSELKRLAAEIPGAPLRLRELSRELEDELARERRRSDPSQIERELMHANAVLQATLEATNDGILVFETPTKLAAHNAKALELWQLAPGDEFTDEHVCRVIKEPEKLLSLVERHWREHVDEGGIFELRDGRIVEFYCGDILIKSGQGRIAIFRDITERLALERRVRISDRMASIGRVAAGVAHEINNPLAHVSAGLELLQELAETPASRASIERLRASTERIARIVSDLNALSRSSERLEPVDVNGAVEKTLPLAIAEIRHRARLTLDLTAGLPRASADEGRLIQIFLNLLTNAAHAIPEGAALENEIRLATRAQGDSVVVELRDTGIGMAPEVLSRIFEPFFTTKPSGHGTGLGLYISYGLVQSMGGTLEVESMVGKGTTFRVRLPVSRQPERAREAGRASAGHDAEHGAAGTREKPEVLIVDDEADILGVLTDALEIDYRVTCVSKGRKALGMLLDDPGRWAAVVCDLMMPDLTGREVYESAIARTPALAERFVFMTAGAFAPAALEFSQGTQRPVIGKPFSLKDVRAVVSAIAARRR